MKNNEILEKLKKLEDLKGETFKLGEWDQLDTRKYTLNDIKPTISSTVLLTNIKALNIPNYQINQFLDSIEILENEAPTVRQQISTHTKPYKTMNTKPNDLRKVDLAIYEPTTAQKTTQQALIDMIQEVKEGNPDAIKKADAICNIAQTLINMEKSQVQLLKLASKIH